MCGQATECPPAATAPGGRALPPGAAAPGRGARFRHPRRLGL